MGSQQSSDGPRAWLIKAWQVRWTRHFVIENSLACVGLATFLI